MNKQEWERLKQDPIKYKEYREKERVREKKRIEKRKNNPQLLAKHRAYFRDYTKSYGKKLKQKARKKLGGRCFQCGNDDVRILEFHHTLKMEKREDSLTMCRRILKGANDIILLCANHHAIIDYGDNKRREIEKKIGPGIGLERFIQYERMILEKEEKIDSVDYAICLLRAQGESWDEIAIQVGMSKGGVFGRGKKLGLTHNNEGEIMN